MKIRVKFTRNPRVKFLGHLDIMRSFQRGFIRAGVKMIYSVGYSPHQKMNFAQPLGVGVTSTGEYLDAEVADGQDADMICKALDREMSEAFDIKSVHIIKEDADKGMAAVRFASYTVTVCEGPAADIGPFVKAESVITLKKTKSGQSEVDIKPWVVDISASGNSYSFTVSAGSENNLKPDLLMQEIYKLDGLVFDRNKVQIERNDLMAKNMVPLEYYQTI